MATSRSSPAFARFDQFEVEFSCKELRKWGVRVPVQEKPFQLLQLLLEAEGKVVTRDELRDSLWSADTFVDFEHSVNVAIGKLRHVLGDSPESPKFIETRPKIGYRFIAPVEWITSNNGTSAIHVVEPIAPPEPVLVVLRPPAVKRHWKLMAIVTVAALAIVALLISLSNENSYLSRTRLGSLTRRVVLGRSTTTQTIPTERGLTANPEDTPITSAVISPDGKYLAYTDKTGFYLKQVENGETHPVPLPKGFEPQAESWFPDNIHMVVSWAKAPGYYRASGRYRFLEERLENLRMPANILGSHRMARP